ncbi:hypothetical protein WG902_04715 [Ramlibacter sp. PS3R-8]|uniref:hypothetical protein n=1 Tax=Ramlibacter sp. PS3R-8 TaxID=3133437 RepID=UPI0030995AE8
MHLARSLCLLACFLSPLAFAQKQTVCTVTINSADEQKTFRKYLPADKYDFVELVERNRKDWLGSACEQKVSCDVLLISGHHGEGNVFFSDALDRGEHLPIAELERVACSDSCPSLFANLKEVYLFGCDTMNPQAQHTVSSEILRSFTREGRSPAEAARLTSQLKAERGESSRDRMRLVFKDVPVIYGFASAAPLGASAAVTLNRHFQSSGAGDVGKGRVSAGLLRQFASQGLVAGRGMTAGDSLAALRGDVCSFSNDRMTTAQRLDSVHKIMQRPVAESRLLLDRIEHFAKTLDADSRRKPEVAQAIERIARDTVTRDRYLAFARDADQPDTRARMIGVAHAVGWLNAQQRRDELLQMMGEMLAQKSVAGTDVGLACTLNKDGALDGALDRLARPGQADSVGHSAVLACMGSTEARTQALKGLVSPDDADVRVAQFYLRHRPITDADELRAVTRAIAGMNGFEAQARALDVLARHYLSDRGSVEILKQLFARTPAWAVQNAIAGVLLRADPKAAAHPDVLRTLREYRLKSLPEGNMVDALIERLKLS